MCPWHTPTLLSSSRSQVDGGVRRPKMDINWFTSEDVNAQTVVVMCGWPDTTDVFSTNIVPLLISAGYRVAGITLPSYRRPAEKRGLFGWSLRTLVNFFEAAINRILESSDPNSPYRHLAPILVCHDWACTIALECLTKRPFMFERIVCLDVSGHPTGDKKHATSATNISSWLVGSHGAVSAWAMMCVMFYQGWIMLSYLVDLVVPVVGNLSIWLLCWLNGRPNYRNKDGLLVRPRADMGWPYFSLWLGLLTRFPLQTHRFFTPVHVPILYLYGERKPFQFHTDQWLHHIEDKRKRDGMSLALGIQNGGHWFFAETGGVAQKLALSQVGAFLALQRKIL